MITFIVLFLSHYFSSSFVSILFQHVIPSMVNELARARLLANIIQLERLNKSQFSSASASTATLGDLDCSKAPPQFSLQVKSAPLPLTDRQSLRIHTFMVLFIALFILIPYCYVPACKRFVHSLFLSLMVLSHETPVSNHLVFCALCVHVRLPD